MKDESNSISTAPLEHPSQDFERLRQEGIGYIQRFAPTTWTDHNAHDPGITILEQLCYAMTDFGYRCGHGMADMVEPDEYLRGSLRGPREMLTCDPVTDSDLRKVALDVDGVLNAWVEPADESSPTMWFDSSSGEVRLGSTIEGGVADPLQIRGRYRVVVQPANDEQARWSRRVREIRKSVTERLHACRGLGTDFEPVSVLEWQDVRIAADLEVGTLDNLDALLEKIQLVLTEFIEPPVRRTVPLEAVLGGKPSEEVFDGPPLTQGAIDTAALDLAPRRRAIRVSDLVRVLMDLPEVQAVRDLMLSTQPVDDAGSTMLFWELPLKPRQVARFDPRNSRIRLTRGKISQNARPRAPVRSRPVPAAESRPAVLRLSPPPGTFRLKRPYLSVQHHFPEVYGIGPFGLPEASAPSRKAQARQLKAYLLMFDQVMASYFSQLQNAHRLFSSGYRQPQTYFPEPVVDDRLGLDEVRDRDASSSFWLRAQIESLPEAYERRNRFLDHLLARFSEDLTDLSLDVFTRRQNQPDVYTELANQKQAFLDAYPRISGARGTGLDALRPAEETRGAYELPAGRSGLEERVRLALGRPPEVPGFMVIEHILLRPVAEDDVEDPEVGRTPPVLVARTLSEPYSLRVTFALSRSMLSSTSKELVERVARNETPAHIRPDLVWLDSRRWTDFERAYHSWRQSLMRYRQERLDGTVSRSTHVLMRLWRDALIESLEIGQTYPLRDVSVLQTDITVTYRSPATIPIAPTQPGVRYTLLKDGEPVRSEEEDVPDAFVHVDGNGAEAILRTPKITDTTTFRIRATNLVSGREVLLRDSVRIEVGIDDRVPVRVNAPFLDPLDEQPPSDAPRIIDFGGSVEVRLLRPQESVNYHVVAAAPGSTTAPDYRVSDFVPGVRGSITITTEPLEDDVDLWVIAERTDGDDRRPLATVVPIKVRARRDVPVTAAPMIFDPRSAPTVELPETQADYTYRAWYRTLTDDDFPFSRELDAKSLYVDVPGEAEPLQVVRPDPIALAGALRLEAATGPDASGTRYQPLAEVQGTGGPTSLKMERLNQDTMVMVEVRKRHVPGISGESAILVNRPALFLVRPERQPGLVATAFVPETGLAATIELSGGQQGVLYRLERDAPSPRPAYFHRYEGQSNVGLGRLRVSRDFAVTRDRVEAPIVNYASTRPLNPTVDVEGSPSGQWQVFAKWARTGVAIELPDPLVIPELPVFEVVEAAGDIAVRLASTDDSLRYRLRVGGRPLEPVEGTGGEVTLEAEAVSRLRRIELMVDYKTPPVIAATLVIVLARPGAAPAGG